LEALAAASTAYATGQRKSIGNSSSCLCNGPTQSHRQLLQSHMWQANVTLSAATAPEYQPMQSHRLLLHLQMQWVNKKSPAVAAGVSGTGKCESIGR